MSNIDLIEMNNLTEELQEVEARTDPFGTFAGTRDFLVVLQNGEDLALDTGDQGGGQS